MKIKNNTLFLLLLILLFAIPLFFYFYSFSNNQIILIVKYETIIKNLIENNYYSFLFLYSIIVFSCVLLNLPGGSIRALLAGFFLGKLIGIFTIILFTTFASLLLFIFYQNKTFIGNNSKDIKLNKFLSAIKNEFLLLVTIRLIPIIPFFLQNITIAKFNISKNKYLLSTMIGIFPSNMLYVIIGNNLEEALSIQEISVRSIIFENKTLIYSITAIVIYILLTNFIAFFTKKNRNN